PMMRNFTYGRLCTTARPDDAAACPIPSTGDLMDLATRRRRRARFVFFLPPGTALASCVTRTPDIREQLQAPNPQMGAGLFALSAECPVRVLPAPGHRAGLVGDPYT